MVAFPIPAGTKVLVIAADKEWYASNFREWVTRHDNLFFLEDVVVDPLGKVATGPQHASVVGGAYAKAGYYGFHSHEGHTHDDTARARALCREGWVLLTRNVEPA